MTWLQAILDILKGLVTWIPKYFPPKSTEQSVEDGQAAIDKKLADEQNGGKS